MKVSVVHWCSITSKRWRKMLAGVLLLLDNALVHSEYVTQAETANCSFELLFHPPYSLELTPSEFFLCPKNQIPPALSLFWKKWWGHMSCGGVFEVPGCPLSFRDGNKNAWALSGQVHWCQGGTIVKIRENCFSDFFWVRLRNFERLT